MRLERAVAALLLVLLAAGSLTLWIGVPAACLWLASRITDDATAHLQISVVTSIAAMVGVAWLLFRINHLYVRLVGPSAPPDDEDEDDEEPRYVRGPLEPILVGSLVIALIAFTVWFFAFAENPPSLF